MARPFVPALQLAVRASVAGAVAVALAQYCDMRHPVYAFITAVYVTDLSPRETRRLALPRFAGTVIGAAFGALGSQPFVPNPYWIGAVVLAAMLVAWLARLDKSVRVAGYVCGVVLINYSDHAWAYAAHRLLETGLGIAVAFAVSFVPKLLPSYEEDPSASVS